MHSKQVQLGEDGVQPRHTCAARRDDSLGQFALLRALEGNLRMAMLLLRIAESMSGIMTSNLQTKRLQLDLELGSLFWQEDRDIRFELFWYLRLLIEVIELQFETLVKPDNKVLYP